MPEIDLTLTIEYHIEPGERGRRDGYGQLETPDIDDRVEVDNENTLGLYHNGVYVGTISLGWWDDDFERHLIAHAKEE